MNKKINIILGLTVITAFCIGIGVAINSVNKNLKELKNITLDINFDDF